MAEGFRNYKFLLFVICAAASLAAPLRAHAFGIDLLGEAAEPLIGPAKEKMKAALVYVWLQPYAGYGMGTTDQSRVAAGGAITTANGLKADGFLWGARGGILLVSSFRVGLDYSSQSLTRNTLVESSPGRYIQSATSGKNTMLGAMLGFDVPYTPVQGFVTKYFKANASGDAASKGDGFGGGISFVIKNPFIFSLETRKTNYSTAADATGKRADSSYKEYYATLSFMLL